MGDEIEVMKMVCEVGFYRIVNFTTLETLLEFDNDMGSW